MNVLSTLLRVMAAFIVIASPFSVFTAQQVMAQDAEVTIGGDIFAAGQSTDLTSPIANDVFAAGNKVNISANVGGDVHVAGNEINMTADAKGNIYALGNSINISGNVGEDISAAGNNVTISSANIGGNVRSGGASVTIEGAVAGSAMIGTAKLELNGTIAGDLEFSGAEILFGPNAKIDGNVTVRSSEEIEIPTRVASADRVTFEKIENHDMGGVAREIADETTRSVFGELFAAVGFYIAIFLIGVVWLALMPKRASTSFGAFAAHPWKSFFAGLVALAALIGMSVVLLLTVFGIVLIPVSAILAVLGWLLGMAAGAYFIARRLASAFGQDADSLGMRVILLAIGLGFVWALGLVPFVGWLLQIASVLFGLGAMSYAAVFGGEDADDVSAIANQG